MSEALDGVCLPCAVGEVARSAGGVAYWPSNAGFCAATPLSAAADISPTSQGRQIKSRDSTFATELCLI